MAAAAQQLHVTPAAVSLGISSLEKALASQLLIRVPHRPLALTDIGRSLVGDARRLLRACDELTATARSQQDALTGPITIGCFTTLAPLHVPQLVARVGEVHPSIAVSIVEESQARLQQLLLDGRIELAIMYDLDIDSRVAVETVAITRPYVVVAGSHRLAGRTSVRLAELEDEPMLMLDIHPSAPYFTSILDDLGVKPLIQRTSHSFETIRSLVARDQGWSMLIQRPTIDVSYEGLDVAAIVIADELADMPIVLASVAQSRPTRRANAVAEICRRMFERE